MSSEHDRKPLAKRLLRVVDLAGIPVVSVILAVILSSVIIRLAGFDPFLAFKALFDGAFGTPRQFGETMMRSTPLIFTGLSVAYGFKAGLFNIGAEGQLFMGGLVAAFLGVSVIGDAWPALVAVPLILIGAMLIGAAWAFVPAILKAKVGAHEVITTMMFTFIARYFVDYLVNGPLRAEGSVPQTAAISEPAFLPRLHEILPFLPESRWHAGFVVAILAAAAVWFILKYTALGYENRAVGFNPWASETGGISVAATTVKALCISGALAGLAGASEVMGLYHKLFGQFSAGFGFTGIAVALLAKNNPIGVIPAAVLFGALSAGAGSMQLNADVPQDVIFIIQGLIILFVAAEGLARWVIGRGRRAVVADAE
ncbi:MAG: ABC transporter permease [Coriobacteriia bacterium]